MQKIISLFARNYDGDRLVRDELVPGAEWVAAGEGIATVKWDGAACRIKNDIDGGLLWRRYDAKKGKQPPPGFEPAQEPNPKTGHYPGWIRCVLGQPADQWFFEALSNQLRVMHLPEGTFEACGPHFQGNPHRLSQDVLYRHGAAPIPEAPRTFAELPGFLARPLVARDLGGIRLRMEGIVWHHPDGRMVKIKAKDFGLPWPPAAGNT